jgi:hypothetical protein
MNQKRQTESPEASAPTAGGTTSSFVALERVENGSLTRLLPVVIVAVVTLVALATVTPWPVGAYQDDAIYTVLAKALATGEGYRMINLPGSPPATHYPPGYPFFLSLLWRLSPSFPDNIVLFKFANAVWLGLTALGVFVFTRSRLHWSPIGAALAAWAGTLAIMVLLVTGVVLSEPMFMAFLFAALLLSERAAEENSLTASALAGFAAGALALIRSLGAVLVPATLMVMIWRRNFRGALVMSAAAAVLLVPWNSWLNAWQHEIPPVLMGKYGAYGPWLATGFQEGGAAFARDVVIANLRSVHRFMGYFFAPVSLAWPRTLAFVGISGLAGIGLAALRKRSPVTLLFLFAYTGVILLWPFEPDRFVIAVWPLLTLCLLAGVRAIWRWDSSRAAGRGLRFLALGASAAMIAGFLSFNIRGYRNQFWASIQRDAGRRAKPMVEWIATQTARSDILMTDDDVLIYLYTGRRGTPTSTFLPRERVRPLTEEDNIAAVRAMIDTYAPRYYITTSEPGRRAAEALTQGGAPLLRRHRLIPNAFIYETISP